MKVNIPVPCVDPDLIQNDGASFCLGCKKNIAKWDGTGNIKEGDCVIAPDELTTFNDAGSSGITKFFIAIFFVFGAQLFSGNIQAQSDSLMSTAEIQSNTTTVIEGLIFNKSTDDLGMFVDVTLMENGKMKRVTDSGFEGYFKFVYNEFNPDSNYALNISSFVSDTVINLPISLKSNGFTDLGKIEVEFKLDLGRSTAGIIIGSVSEPFNLELNSRKYTYDQFRLLKLNGQIK
ncbi:MAG: hypothetical protein ACI9J3_000413 [Parvicellaceae bacterium]|jgi:hypothetical protein